MKTRSFMLATAGAALAMLYVLMPACGQNNQQSGVVSPYGYSTTCVSGVCSSGLPGMTGVSLTATPIMTSIDSFGSVAQLQFGATSGVAPTGVYSGPVSLSGIIQINPGGMCPPGVYQVTGQGQWVNQTGIPQVQAQFQMMGTTQMQGMLSGNVLPGPDPYVPSATSQYHFSGPFETSCDPGGTAL